MYPLVATTAQYTPPTSSFFYLLYEIKLLQQSIREVAYKVS